MAGTMRTRLDTPSASAKPQCPEFASRWFSGEGSIRIHALVAGHIRDPAILLLHGFPDFSRTWRHQIKPLVQRGYYVVAVDLRGAGRSSVPSDPNAYHLDRHVADVRSVIDQLEQSSPKGVTLVAHDFGAHVGWLTTMRHEPHICRLVVINGVHPAHARLVGAVYAKMRSLIHVALLQPPGLAETILTPDVLVEVLAAQIPKHLFTMEDVAEYRETFGRPGVRRGMFEWYRQLARAVASKRGLEPCRVRTPVVTMLGLSDPFVDRDLVEPPPSWVTPPPASYQCKGGHWLHWDNPIACIESIPRHPDSAR